jgi:Major Facilitator Superfamily
MTQVSANSTSACGATNARALPRSLAFWAVAVIAAMVPAASSAPSPLYPVYQAQFRFSSLTLTVIFAVYVFALMASLLTVGRLSDYLGRRVVLAGALIVDAGAMALFLGADGVGWLLAARVVQGLATGAAIGAVGAYLLDLQPIDGSRLGSLLNTVAPTFGLGVGAAATGLLVQYAPLPTRLIFAVLTALFVASALALITLPETAERMPGAVAALRPQVAVPTRARRAFAGAVPTVVATWALGGLILSLGGSLLGAVFEQTNHAVVGVVIGLFPFSAAAAAVAARELSPSTMARIGNAALLIGTCLFLVALGSSSTAVFVAATILAGGGFGLAFLGALRSVSQLAEPHERAALLSAVYLVSYVAFSVPAMVEGLITTHIGLLNTSFGYGGFVALVAAGALAFERLSARPHRDAV